MKKVFITGVSGTGKTTLAEELHKRGFYTISADEVRGLCSWVNKETKEKVGHGNELTIEFTQAHSWICDVEQLKELMDVNKDVVIVLGILSNQKEFLHLFDQVLLLEATPETFISRIENRTNNNFGKDKNVQNKILSWYQGFNQGLLDKGAISINANKSIGEVVDQVLDKIR